MKAKVSKWLLISLLPVGLLVVVCFLVLMLAPTDPATETWSGGWSVLAGLMFLLAALWCVMLVAGVVTRLLHINEVNRRYREAQRYAELNDWYAISKTMWRTYRGDDILLSVNGTHDANTYVLTITADADSVSNGGFETALFALQFGDWLWRRLERTNSRVNSQVVQEQRQEWEHERALAVRSNPGEVSPRFR